MDPLLAVAFVMVALAGAAVVAVRDPLEQSIVVGFFGLLLSLLFTLLQAPDVALSEMVVGAVAVPLMVLITVAKTRTGRRQ
jgi:uncharacterized MnhB-related membrane protein